MIHTQLVDTEEEVESTKVPDIELAETQAELAIFHGQRYKKTGDIEDLEAAVKYGESMVAATPEGHPDMARRHQIVAVSYTDRYRRTGDLEDLEAALRHKLSAVAATPEGHPDMADRHHNLAVSYRDRYQRTGNLDDQQAALRYNLSAVAATPEGHPNMADRQHNLAVSYRDRYQRTGDLTDLEAALEHNLTAVTATPEGHPGMAGRYNNLAISYRDRYQRAGNLEDLQAAIRYKLSAVAATLEGHPDMAGRQHSLAVSYRDRYQRTGNQEDLEAALEHGLIAVATTPEGHPDMAGKHHSLAVFSRDKYQQTRDLKYLEAALDHNLRAVTATPEGHPDMASRHQSLAVFYRDRYQRTGDLRDLEAAIEHNLTAVTATPEGHPDMAGKHHSLAISYTDRYQRTGDLEDLEVALEHDLKAVDATPEGHPDMADRHHNLAISYRDRYQRTGNQEDLEAALRYKLSALAATPEGHPDMADRHHNLAVSYRDRYQKTRDLQDLKAALRYNLLAVDATPKGHPDMADRHQSLALSYGDRYQRTGDLEDLDAALRYKLSAVAATPEGHPDMADRHQSLAVSYTDRYQKTRDQENLSNAHKLYQSGLKSLNAPPQDLWSIAMSYTWKRHLFPSQDILEAYSIALNVLPSLLWLGSTLDNRHDRLIRHHVPTFISQAVHFALQCSQPSLAVEFIEQGLSTTHKQNLQLKDDHLHLQAQLPTLSQKFHQVSLQLQGSSHKADSTANYHALSYERQKLIAEIHDHPGFENFLLPPSYSNLCLAAKNGPVIILNYDRTEDKADAILIVKPDLPPFHLPLPGVKQGGIQEHQEKLRNALKKLQIPSRNQNNGSTPETHIDPKAASELLIVVIRWLWTSIVQPVFEVLSKHGIIGGRLWWCPSGPFTYFPLHAAAPLKKSTFIQSYIPTLDILIHANSNQASGSGNNLLTAIGVSKTFMPPEGIWPEIPLVNSEIEIVATLFGDQSKQLQGPQASIKNVMAAMQSSSWLHLACHGEQVPGDPLQSGLILHEEKLSLSQILKIDLPNAKFVYLSACETAMGDGKLENEAMHLAGGFLSAGFQGAIGTLWSIMDDVGPQISKRVYQKILGENGVPDVMMAAEGLHAAILELRKAGVHRYRWMPFVHFGV